MPRIPRRIPKNLVKWSLGGQGNKEGGPNPEGPYITLTSVNQSLNLNSEPLKCGLALL